MNDSYSELLVKKEQTGKDKVIKFLLIGVIAATAVVGVIIPLVWVLTLGLGIAAYFILPNLDLEYEYVYVNGELDIDKIMAKSKRKRVQSFDLAKMESGELQMEKAKMEFMEPVNSHRMDYQNHNTKLKVLDFSSGNKEHKVYAMIIPDEKEICKVLLEPDQTLLENIQKSCPRKVFMD